MTGKAWKQEQRVATVAALCSNAHYSSADQQAKVSIWKREWVIILRANSPVTYFPEVFQDPKAEHKTGTSGFRGQF